MSDPKKDVLISKALSYLLRHGATKEKLEIDSTGYVKLSDILLNNRLKTHKTTLQDIQRIVENNDKKRFSIINKDEVLYICANQGHSLKKISNDNLLLLTERSQYPNQLIHGTTQKNIKLIIETGGLSKMNRNHIHFTSKLSNEDSQQSQSISGLRNFSTILIYLDIDKLINDNIKFYKSINDVYLCEGDEEGKLSIKYFKKIILRSTGELIDQTNI